jgi:hypothetical protein
VCIERGAARCKIFKASTRRPPFEAAASAPALASVRAPAPKPKRCRSSPPTSRAASITSSARAMRAMASARPPGREDREKSSGAWGLGRPTVPMERAVRRAAPIAKQCAHACLLHNDDVGFAALPIFRSWLWHRIDGTGQAARNYAHNHRPRQRLRSRQCHTLARELAEIRALPSRPARPPSRRATVTRCVAPRAAENWSRVQ